LAAGVLAAGVLFDSRGNRGDHHLTSIAKKPACQPQHKGASGASGSGSSAGGPLSSWLVQGSTPLVAAAIRAGSSWKKLSRRSLTRSISTLAGRLRKQLEECRGGYAQAGYSVTSDGWSDVNRRALINVVGYL
jgi:hypothetical protein